MEKPSVAIKEIESMRIIYIRFRGTYVEYRKHSRKLFAQLFKFAQTHDLIIPDITKVLTIYHDNPFITDEENLRTSVAMTIPDDVHIDETDEICAMTISGKFAVGRFELKRNNYGDAWHYMYQQWLFKSEEKPRDSFPFELYVSEPPQNLREKSIAEIYIPIE